MTLRDATRADALVAGLVLLFAVLAIALHDAVDDLGRMGRSLGQAGAALQSSATDNPVSGRIRRKPPWPRVEPSWP